MAKRKHAEEETAHLAASTGLGRPKRVKLSIVANKENIQITAPIVSKPIQKVREAKKTLLKPEPVRSTRTARTTLTTLTTRKSPRRRVLQDKAETKAGVSNLRKEHPISKHITKSNLYNYEGWIEQQEAVFTSVLNGIIGPSDWRKDDWEEDMWEDVRELAFLTYQTASFQTISSRIERVSFINHMD